MKSGKGATANQSLADHVTLRHIMKRRKGGGVWLTQKEGRATVKKRWRAETGSQDQQNKGPSTAYDEHKKTED